MAPEHQRLEDSELLDRVNRARAALWQQPLPDPTETQRLAAELEQATADYLR